MPWKAKGLITIKIKEQPGHVIVDVTDNGKGISKKNIAKVFKPGFTTKKRAGARAFTFKKNYRTISSGAVVCKISEPGKGTTFRIVLNT